MRLTPGLHAKESAIRSAIAGGGPCRWFLHVSRRRQRACHGCFLARDVLRGALLTVESTPICKRGVHEQHWQKRKSLQLAFAHNIRSLGKGVRIVYRRVYGTLSIKCIFIIKRIVSSCGYYKCMRLTTGVYGIFIIYGILVYILWTSYPGNNIVCLLHYTGNWLFFIHLSSNLLLNIGPMADGTLDPVFEERLLEMGAWLDVSQWARGLYGRSHTAVIMMCRWMGRPYTTVFHGSIRMTLQLRMFGTLPPK